jgi:hypothetical protein
MNTATDSFFDAMKNMWTNVLAFAPKFLLFVVIIAVGYFISKWIARLVEVVLNRIGFDRLTEKSGIDRAMARSPYHASEILRKIVFFALFLIVLQLAFTPFGPNAVNDILTRTITFLPALFVALLIVIIAAALATMVKGIVGAVLSRVSYGPALSNTAGAAIVTIGIFAALSHLQIAPAIVNGLFYAALAVVAGSAIVAIGGGGIAPMRQQWEKALQKLEQENLKLKTPAPESELQHNEVEEEVKPNPRFSTQGTPPVGYQPKERSRPE